MLELQIDWTTESSAFYRFVRRVADRFQRVDQEELVDEVWEILHGNGFRNGEYVTSALLRTIISRRELNHQRSCKRRRFVELGESGNSLASREKSPEVYAQEQEDFTRLQKGLETLPERERVSVKTRFGFPGSPTVAELALVLGKSRKTTERYSRHALKRLRDSIERIDPN